MRNLFSTQNCQLSVFDGDRLVAIFKIAKKCMYYFFMKNGTWGNKIARVKKPRRKTIFGMPLVFKYSSEEQKRMLGDKDFIILDDRFKK